MTKKTNIASSGFTAVQAGHVGPPDETQTDTPEPPKRPRKPDNDRTINIQSGKGRVSVQADTIVGDINIKM